MRAVFVVGMRGPVPRVAGAEGLVLPLHRLKEAGRPRREGTLLLLGPDVLDRIPPVRIQRLLPFPYGIAAALPASESGPSNRRWVEAHIEVLPPGTGRQERLEALARIEVRITVRPGYWVPPGVEKDPVLRHAVELLPRLRKIDVVNWTAELGLERHYLGPRCRNALGLEARVVCKRYLVIYSWLERSRGIPWGHIAAALGFPNASNLRAAIGASKWIDRPRKPPPPADPPDPPRPTPDSPRDAPDSPSKAPNSPLTRTF